MVEHRKFPSIEQFRNVIKEVQFHHKNVPQPTLKFRGTVKLHGTNSAVCLAGDTIWFQSRNNVITPENDNAGFAAWASTINWNWLFDQLPFSEVEVYGEWCGGNIQSGVAITGLPKMFVIFKIHADGKWLPMAQYSFLQRPDLNIFNIENFKTWEMEIDFNKPALVQNDLIEITNSVEAECPVGKHFGKSGVGEGVVWTCVTPEYDQYGFVFKVKGERHVGGTWIEGIELSSEDRQKVINFCLANKINEFDFEFLE